MNEGSSQPNLKTVSSRNATRELDGARIIIILMDLESGGASRQAQLVAQHLVNEQKANVEVWTLGRPTDDPVSQLKAHGIRIRNVRMNWFTHQRLNKIRDLMLLAWALRRARPKAILSYQVVPNVVGGLIWRVTGAKLFIWNQRYAGRERLGERFERLAVTRTPCFIANSQSGADFLVRTLGAPNARVRIIADLVELAPARIERSGWRDTLGLNQETFVACMVADIDAYRDHEILLRTWRLVLDQQKPYKFPPMLLLAGRPSQNLEDLKALAFDLDLDQHVMFLGYVDDVTGLLKTSDMAVFSLTSDGSVNAVLEAMAAGLPIVATDQPEIRKVLGSSNHQYLTPPRDSEGLAERISRFASDSDLRKEVGAANRRRIEEEFDPQKQFAQTASVIITGLEESRSRRRSAIA